MGISRLPTAAQRDNEKSGIAIERIQTSQVLGSYHFTAGYERALSAGTSSSPGLRTARATTTF
jgi:hypothetical protein